MEKKEISTRLFKQTIFLGEPGKPSKLNSIVELIAKGYETFFISCRFQEDTTKFTRTKVLPLSIEEITRLSAFLADCAEGLKDALNKVDYKTIDSTVVLLDKTITTRMKYSLTIKAVILYNKDTGKKSRVTELTFGKMTDTGELDNVTTVYLPTYSLGFKGSGDDITLIRIVASILESTQVGTNVKYSEHRSRQYRTNASDNAGPSDDTPANTESEDQFDYSMFDD